MRKILVVCTLLVLVASVGGFAAGKDHAADQALDNAAYQSALVERYDLPGDRIPLPWWIPPSEGWYIGQDQPTFWALGWIDPTGKDSKEAGVGPGRSNYSDRGSGKITFRLWVDNVEVNLNRTGEVGYFPGLGLWGVLKHWWITFPAYYFGLGPHTFYFELDVANLPQYHMEESIVVNFD